MTEAARWNLQHRIPEDTRFEYTTYTAETPFDKYILQQQKLKQLIYEQQLQKELEEAAAAKLESVFERELENLLKDFK